jgi:NTP pyrophosphatase (non-canonical NTP hydrolase)
MNNVEHFKKIATELGGLYEKKNKAYGNSFSYTYKKLGLISAVTRISDKYNRLCNLAKNPDIDNLDESIEDTLRDMASYCIMAVMELENERNLVNDKIMRCIEREEGIVTSKEDEKIHKGDMFECIKYFAIGECDEIIFTRGKSYVSESDGCITDNTGTQRWLEKFNWQEYFKRI